MALQRKMNGQTYSLMFVKTAVLDSLERENRPIHVAELASGLNLRPDMTVAAAALLASTGEIKAVAPFTYQTA